MHALKASPDRSCLAIAPHDSVTFSQVSGNQVASLFTGLRKFRFKVLSLALLAHRCFFFFLSIRVLVSLILAIALDIPDAMANAADPAENGYNQGPTRLDLLSLISPGMGHMLRNLSHILFLMCIVFFLIRLKHIGTYVSLFVIGHFMAMILGVYFGVGTNIHLINVMVGLSMVYKAMEYFGVFQRWNRIQPNAGVATLVFAVFHGIGLATNILDYQILPYGLVRDVLA